jgi:PEP-CTERM motif
MRRKWSALAVFLLLGCFDRAEAGSITYTETVTGSGSLGGVAFTDELITIAGTADTNNVVMPAPGVFIVLTSTEVTVATVGSATFTDTVQAVDNQPNLLAGFGDNSANLFLLGNHNSAFATYDLKSPIGPTSGTVVVNRGASFATTVGTFEIDSVSTDGTFSAATTSAVPEPSSLVMLGIGVVSILGLVRRR